MKTLVLNAGYEPLCVVSFKRALLLVINGKARVIVADPHRQVHSVSSVWEYPSVIILSHYVRRPHLLTIPVSRRGVLRRDHHSCAYCGTHANTVDHVIPRSRGGEDSWLNLVACCHSCNNLKGNATPRELGWRLRFAPKSPSQDSWFVSGIESPLPQWDQFLRKAA